MAFIYKVFTLIFFNIIYLLHVLITTEEGVIMKNLITTLSILIIIKAFLFAAPSPALAQLEILSTGRLKLDSHAGFGTNPNSYTWLYVRCTEANDCAEDYFEEEDAIAVRTHAADSYENYGLLTSSFYGFLNYGVNATAWWGERNYGVFTRASQGSVLNRAIHAWSPNDPGKNYAGFFSGDVEVTGSFSSSSDERLKKNLQFLDGANSLSRLAQLEPRNYEFLSEQELIQQGLPLLSFPEGTRMGLLAQNVEQIFPELVTDVVHVLDYNIDADWDERQNGETMIIKSVDYISLIPVLISAIQEQQAEIEELKSRLDQGGL